MDQPVCLSKTAVIPAAAQLQQSAIAAARAEIKTTTDPTRRAALVDQIVGLHTLRHSMA